MTAVSPGAGRCSTAATLTADVLAGVTVALVVATVVCAALAGNVYFSGESTLAITVTFLAAGYLVARRQPANPVGWLLLVTGLAAGFTAAAGMYPYLDYKTYGGTLPLGPAVVFCENTTWPVSLLAGMATVLLFPDGRLTAPWRRALRAYAVVSALTLVTQAIPAAIIARLDVPTLIRVEQGAASPGVPSWVRLFAWGLPVLAAAPFWLAFIVRQVIGYRRASGDVRQQYKWFIAGAAVTGISLVVMTISQVLPVSLSTPQAVAIATLAAAALFNPLRRRVQRIVDRRFNRARYDADRTITAFSARLQGTPDLDDVSDDLLGVIRHALEPAHATLWLRQDAAAAAGRAGGA